MNEELLRSLVERRLSQRAIANELGVSVGSVRYWLRRYQLPVYRLPHGRYPETPTWKLKCGQCGETDSHKFYGKKFYICGRCANRENLKRGQQKRLKAINLLGGKCSSCGYDKYSGALDLHHRDPREKDVKFRSMRSWSWERIVEEIKKCDLLCKNCHAERHADMRDIAQLG